VRRRPPHRATGPWRIAEWVSLTISVLLVGSVAAFLLVQALRPRSPYLEVEARLLVEQTEPRGEGFVAPLQVTNRGERTLTRILVSLRGEDEGDAGAAREIELHYLGGGTTRTTYVVFDRDPRGRGAFVARALHYDLE
jgi:uncharacterized protein (TIGR02588 family)